ncbi:MAG: hypothetical protein ACREBQ_10130 [Nitrososphaerales archaeon]
MAISCNTILYRAVLRSSWFDPDDQTKVKPEAFFRRPPRQKDNVRDPQDEDGLSLFRADKISPDDCIREFRRCFGVVSLHVGTLMDLGLTVIEDERDPRKLLVTNLPFENPGTALGEKLVGDVSDTARIVKRHRP